MYAGGSTSWTRIGAIFPVAGSNTFPPVESSRLVRAAFAVLVVATVAAFFFTQSLKTEVPVVLRFAAQPRDISPNADRVRDGSRVGFDLSEPAEVSFYVIDADGEEVRRLVDGRRAGGGHQASLQHGTGATTTAAWWPTACTGCGWHGARRGAASTPSRRCGWTPDRRGSASLEWRPTCSHPVCRAARDGCE